MSKIVLKMAEALRLIGGRKVAFTKKFTSMHTRSRQTFIAGFVAILCSISGYGQAQPQPAQPPEYSKSQLETEQRIMRADLTDTNYHIDRTIKSVAADLPESAKVSLLRATAKISELADLMKNHSERIERLSFSLFYVRENIRQDLRKNFAKIREDFGSAEDSMYAVRKDMLKKGIFGEALKQQIAVLDALPKMLEDLDKKDPATAQKVRDLRDQINAALAAGDSAKASDLLKQLSDTLKGAGYSDAISNAVQKINDSGGVGSTGSATGNGGAAAGSQALQGGGSLASGADGLVLTGSDGQTAKIPGATALDGGKARLKSGEVVDLNGSKVLPNGDILLADGRTIKNGNLFAQNPDLNAKLLDSDQNEIADEYVWKDGKGQGVDKKYVGGKGARLVQEVKVTVVAAPTDSPNTYSVTKTPGEARSWSFAVAPVSGSEKKSSGSLTITLAVTDKNGGTGFTISKWEITGPSGSPSLDQTSGAEVHATFTASATYTVQVSGTTDWGSPFVIKSSLPVGVE